MSFIRSTALRASSFTRVARPTRYIRAAELQPWQRAVQRRTYASAHGATKSSDAPWAAAAVVSTAVGLWVVYTQDLGGHGEHDDHHDEAHGKDHEEDAPAEEESKEEEPKEEKDDKKDDSKASSPDKSDKADPRKEPKSQNETSGKQEGLSNTDTKHSSEVSKDPEKSKKGEGVAETAKVKGTVSTDRPPAENKEEQGKSSVDKDA
ncbi:hypothetical protein IQ07DRAFT_590672 [Pyrenochaeta sp. DS3sAY3a]|nr:hypothetical protein IQ07DRAFT_590672 [Pyrenochaeta sp. DS3sAY3a]